MKTVETKQLDQRISELLKSQPELQPIRIINNGDLVAWILRTPDAMKDVEIDAVFIAGASSGRGEVILRASPLSVDAGTHAVHQPVFGAGRGSLTVLSEDDDHLKDFQEYME